MLSFKIVWALCTDLTIIALGKHMLGCMHAGASGTSVYRSCHFYFTMRYACALKRKTLHMGQILSKIFVSVVLTVHGKDVLHPESCAIAIKGER